MASLPLAKENYIVGTPMAWQIGNWVYCIAGLGLTRPLETGFLFLRFQIKGKDWHFVSTYFADLVL